MISILRPARLVRALAALGAVLPLAAHAADRAQPTFTPLAGASLAKAAHEGKLPGRARDADLSTEIQATLGADGKVTTRCVTVHKSAFGLPVPPRTQPGTPKEPQ